MRTEKEVRQQARELGLHLWHSQGRGPQYLHRGKEKIRVSPYTLWDHKAKPKGPYAEAATGKSLGEIDAFVAALELTEDGISRRAQYGDTKREPVERHPLLPEDRKLYADERKLERWLTRSDWPPSTLGDRYFTPRRAGRDANRYTGKGKARMWSAAQCQRYVDALMASDAYKAADFPQFAVTVKGRGGFAGSAWSDSTSTMLLAGDHRRVSQGATPVEMVILHELAHGITYAEGTYAGRASGAPGHGLPFRQAFARLLWIVLGGDTGHMIWPNLSEEDAQL
jgi:putative metallohydrolase (TIGR04338 family)